MKPKILITLDTGETDRRGVKFANVNLKSAYVDAVARAGGVPLLVAPTDDTDLIEALVPLMDGLVVTGGAFDIDPASYGASVEHRIDAPKPMRTAFERALIEAALAGGKPVLGVCGGMQLLNVVLGGTLIQDIGAQIEGALEHEQPTSPAGPHHDVELMLGGLLTRLTGRGKLSVNSTHHQALDALGRGLYVEGRSPDGVIEAIAMVGRPEVFGVQWHPELQDDATSAAIYGHLVAAAMGPP
jgi:putative glutamine amidotransferase